MSSIEIKKKLLKMIEEETDASLLQAIHTLLQKSSLDPTLRSKLTTRALKSEEDIKSGKLFTKDAVIKQLNRK